MTKLENKEIDMQEVEFENERYYKISNYNLMRPFFMSIVSDANHWMFISSNGGLSAGRKNPDFALFPYYTDDKISESADITGSKSIFQIQKDGETIVWEPFSERFNDKYAISRNLYKNIYGNKIVFEEILHDLNITFRYQWNSSNRFGFVRKVSLMNGADKEIHIKILDGIQNIVPFGVGSDLQNTTSNLVDAYKRSELEPNSGLGIFALSAIIVDKAEPSEALEANIAWATGLDADFHLLSSLQLNNFRHRKDIHEERDIKGEKGAYFICKETVLAKSTSLQWKIVCNVRQNHAQIIQLAKMISENDQLDHLIEDDIETGTENLIRLNGTADGLQYTEDHRKDHRHFANTLFNIMRGGIFDDNYKIEKNDFVQYLNNANKSVAAKNQLFVNNLPDVFDLFDLKANISGNRDVDLLRLCIEYLPLKFSRRHGDPSRPWNRFSINTQSELDGSKILDYQGNWRDIFQNWEALAHAYPEFIEGMIFKFVNASTFDGYNPYRVTKSGFDWETIEPDNPWSYIGYWGDHQVIYLLKFLEFAEYHQPALLSEYFENNTFVYADVPYRIKPYSEILLDPKNTISFDHKADLSIRNNVSEFGADACLKKNSQGTIHHVNFMEKLLSLVLSKLSNFIPEGGIWMNTQRPEWNDANNALVGNGVSMVTLYYFRRFFKFFEKMIDQIQADQVEVSEELGVFFDRLLSTLASNQHHLSGKMTDKNRKIITDALGLAGSDFRENIYDNGFSGVKTSIPKESIVEFTTLTLKYLEHTIAINQRTDGLYHAYNLMKVNGNEIEIKHLSEMLEGQVAVISSGYLDEEATLKLLDAMKSSPLYRSDQNSYMLYPNKELPGFLQKNDIPADRIKSSELLTKLSDDNNLEIINQDIVGGYHFNGSFKNANDLKDALEAMKSSEYENLVVNGMNDVLQLFEDTFNHIAFTGRSGTFYAYEGLGSIYWHMVSKLHLAVQEVCLSAIRNKKSNETILGLIAHYYNIGEGIGVHKSPDLYGAFPTDPYSHTPGHKGAQQPGMTGQVKEDILIRFSELGVFVNDGQIFFKPGILKKSEFLTADQTVTYFNIMHEKKELDLKTGSIFFTYCQIPIVYQLADKSSMEVFLNSGTSQKILSLNLDFETSKKVFNRTGEILQIIVSIDKDILINESIN